MWVTFKCDYHVHLVNITNNWLESHNQKLKYQLVYSQDADVHEGTKQKLYNHTNDQFTKYFQVNWDECQEIWVTFKCDYDVHLVNMTNNRLESHNQKT